MIKNRNTPGSRCSAEGNRVCTVFQRYHVHVTVLTMTHVQGTTWAYQGRVNASQRVYKMRSFQENLSIFTSNSTNLLIQISELNELREQLRKALQSAEIAAADAAEEKVN
jgi:hypothetical protein